MIDSPQNIFTQSTSIHHHDVYLSESLEAPVNYIELCQLLKTAGENDTIDIYINSVGGNVAAALQIVECMENCQATITAHIEGECHSAATYIFLAADNWVIGKHVIFLVHNYTSGAYGKGQDLVGQVKAINDWVISAMESIYGGFLTTEEIAKVCLGQDMWLTGDVIFERLNSLTEFRKRTKNEEEALYRKEVREQLEELIQEYSDDPGNGTENSSGVQEQPE